MLSSNYCKACGGFGKHRVRCPVAKDAVEHTISVDSPNENGRTYQMAHTGRGLVGVLKPVRVLDHAGPLSEQAQRAYRPRPWLQASKEQIRQLRVAATNAREGRVIDKSSLPQEPNGFYVGPRWYSLLLLATYFFHPYTPATMSCPDCKQIFELGAAHHCPITADMLKYGAVGPRLRVAATNGLKVGVGVYDQVFRLQSLYHCEYGGRDKKAPARPWMIDQTIYEDSPLESCLAQDRLYLSASLERVKSKQRVKFDGGVSKQVHKLKTGVWLKGWKGRTRFEVEWPVEPIETIHDQKHYTYGDALRRMYELMDKSVALPNNLVRDGETLACDFECDRARAAATGRSGNEVLGKLLTGLAEQGIIIDNTDEAKAEREAARQKRIEPYLRRFTTDDPDKQPPGLYGWY